jgi:hypothetical protein
MSAETLKERLSVVLSRVQPPDNPIIATGWAGLAFDRNRYEDLAPLDVWRAWFNVYIQQSSASDAIGVVSEDELTRGENGVKLAPSLASLRQYWSEDGRFLRDHYVFAPDFTWVIRLDQDVTLFAAQLEYMGAVVARLHGLDSVMERMVVDFDPGEGDPVGLMGFLLEITNGLRDG